MDFFIKAPISTEKELSLANIFDYEIRNARGTVWETNYFSISNKLTKSDPRANLFGPKSMSCAIKELRAFFKQCGISGTNVHYMSSYRVQ